MNNATRYSIAVRQTEVDGELLFEARVKEFSGLVAYESDPHEAYQSALALIEDSLEILAAEGTKLPAPVEPEMEYSGRVTLRLPRSIHKILAEAAESDDCSLNQHIVNSLCESIGFHRAQDDASFAWYSQTTKSKPVVMKKRHLTIVRSGMPEQKKWAN